jgi:hypothetical protein
MRMAGCGGKSAERQLPCTYQFCGAVKGARTGDEQSADRLGEISTLQSGHLHRPVGVLLGIALQLCLETGEHCRVQVWEHHAAIGQMLASQVQDDRENEPADLGIIMPAVEAIRCGPGSSDDGGNDSLNQVGSGLGQRAGQMPGEFFGGVGVRRRDAHGSGHPGEVERCSA